MSLRLRLTLLTGLLTGATVLAFALGFYLVLRANLLDATDRQLQERAALLAERIAESEGDARLPAVSSLIEFDSPGIYVELLTANGRVRDSSPNVPAGGLPTTPDVLRALQTNTPTIATVTTGVDEDLRLLVLPLGQPSGNLLIVAESLEPSQRALDQARSLLLVCGALALACAVLGAALLTGRALAPIKRLTGAAAEVARTGQYHQRVPVPLRNDEIGQLATTINELIATVEQTLGQQRQFLADTSHELRSPLTAVLANLDLLRRDLDAHERELSVREATAETQRMRRLVNDLLLLARSDVAQAIARAPVQVDAVVQETVAVVMRQHTDRQVDVQVERQLVVLGDRERLVQVVRNLLDNAVRYTPIGSWIVVRLQRQHGYAELTVADTGPGIPPEHLPHIWDRFYRVDKARSREYGGSGLGLAIVKYIVEAHGGSARVASIEGRGTTFTITLPLASETPAARVPARATLLEARPTVSE
jgi:heavy metal sensor kinase